MEMKDVLKKLREKNSLTQEQMAKRVMVTRQAVSRWETGETQPNTDTLKLLSQEFESSPFKTSIRESIVILHNRSPLPSMVVSSGSHPMESSELL